MSSNEKCAALTMALCLSLVALMAAVPATMAAQGSASLTITDAVSRALAHNNGIAASRYAREAAVWAHRQTKAQLLPSIGLESSYTRLDEDTVERANAIGREFTIFVPDGEGGFEPVTITIPQTVFREGYETSFTGQLLLFQPQVWNGMALAGASRDLAGHEENAAVQETVHRTLRACLELLKTESLVEVQREHLKQAQDNTALAERMFDVGRYSEADILQWRVEEVRQQGQLTIEQSRRRIAAIELENLMGVPPTGTVLIENDLPPEITAQIEQFKSLDPASWEAFGNQALEEVVVGNPTLDVLAETENLARLQHRGSKYNFLPSVYVGGSYGWQNNDTIALDGDETWSVNVTLSMPLFTSGSNYSELKMTQYKIKQAQEESTEARRGLYLSGEVARTLIHTNTELLRLAETSLESSRRNLEIMRNNYTLGRLTNLEFIDANLQVQNAEQVFTSAFFDLALAITDYYQAGGDIEQLLRP